ncbi:MAG: hypothetical protein HYS23_06930 [Geobacter sp.]|nr:hypothetical protein [Geobacter sp.]
MGSTLKKKDQKIAEVVASLPLDFSEADFIARFQELYPEEWEKIGEKHQQQLRDQEPGMVLTMPEPRRYLSNILRVWKRKQAGKAELEAEDGAEVFHGSQLTTHD